MIQKRILDYFERYPQLHVLFIFDRANIIQNDLFDCTWDDGVVYKVFDGAWFNTKYNLQFTWKDKRVILLFPLGTYPVSEEQQLRFPLMDMLKANMEYKDEDYAAFMQQYHLPEKFRTFIQRHVAELQSSRVLAILQDRLSPKAFSEDVAVRGIVTSYLGEKNLLDWEAIAIRMLILGLDSEKKKRLDFFHRLLRNQDINRAVDGYLSRIFGFSYDPNTEEKVRSLAESLKYNSMTQLLDAIPGDPYKDYKVTSSLSLEQMNRIYEYGMRHKTLSDRFQQSLNELGAAIREEELITLYGMDASFYYLTERLAWPILQEIAVQKVVADPSDALEHLRRLSQKMPAESVIQRAVEFLRNLAMYYEAVKGLGSLKFNTPDAYVRKYLDDFYRLDTFYRCAIEQYYSLLDKDIPVYSCLSELKQRFDVDYARLVNVLNLEWLACVTEKDGGFDNIPLQRQQDFYANEYRPDVKQVFIISDALRYEMAAELMDKLASDKHMAALSAYGAVLPTETKYGKTSLLPHESLVWKDNEQWVDGAVLNTLESRSAQVAKYLPGTFCVDFDSVYKLDRDAGRALFRRPLVYIFYNTIDSAGHGASAGEVISACRKAIDQLSALIHKLHTSWNVTSVVLTADHGFLYNDVEFADKDKHAVEESEVFEKKTRYYLAPEPARQEGIVSFPLDKVSGMVSEKAVYVGVPKGTNRLAAPGGYAFAHGGASLQELIIPIIRSSQKRTDKTDKVGVALIDRNLTMVSSRLKFRLIQSEAVSMTVTQRKVVCLVYQDDTPVTAEKCITLDSTDAVNLNNRMYEVVLKLDRTVTAGVLQLRVYDADDRLNPLIRETVKNNTIIEQDF